MGVSRQNLYTVIFPHLLAGFVLNCWKVVDKTMRKTNYVLNVCDLHLN